MSGYNRSKIKEILRDWPSGTIATYSWLAAYDVYPQLVDRYIKNGWLTRLTAGAFVKLGDKPTWAGAIYSLQQLGLSVHIGGRSAIELRGYGHYARHQQRIDLYRNPKAKLPAWFKKLTFTHTVFQDTATRLFDCSNIAIDKHIVEGFALASSSLERAMLEMLAFVPQHYGYAEAAHLMESLRGLRPAVVQQLLEQCQSVKAKRLFLHLATLCQHSWLTYVKLENVDLGSGVRKLPGGTYFDKQYQLYVPENSLNEGYHDAL